MIQIPICKYLQNVSLRVSDDESSLAWNIF